MHNNLQLAPPSATGSRLLDQVRDVSRSDMSPRPQKTAWLKSRSGPTALEQPAEAQAAEFFRLDCVRGGPRRAAAIRRTPEEAHGYRLSGVSSMGMSNNSSFRA